MDTESATLGSVRAAADVATMSIPATASTIAATAVVPVQKVPLEATKVLEEMKTENNIFSNSFIILAADDSTTKIIAALPGYHSQ